MNLYERIKQTEPGRHACDIGEVLYCCRTSLGKVQADRLSAAQAYLEKLAIDALKKTSEPWVRELVEREVKVAKAEPAEAPKP